MGETFHLEDMHFEGPNLDVPDPPPAMPYEQYEDYRARELLAINGVEPTDSGVLNALSRQQGHLLAAAAHTAGSSRLAAAEPALRALLDDDDARVALEAAYALARMGADSARDRLTGHLSGNPEVDLAPSVAAGYLAQLGDTAGVEVLRRSLGSFLEPVRMMACKQLYFLGRLLGITGAAAELFESALADASPNVQWQALAQLRMLRDPASRPLLEEYRRSTGEDDLRGVADEIIRTL